MVTPEEAFRVLRTAALSYAGGGKTLRNIHTAADTLERFVNALDPAARRAALARAAYDSQASTPSRNIPDPTNDVIDEHDQHSGQANT